LLRINAHWWNAYSRRKSPCLVFAVGVSIRWVMNFRPVVSMR
jgi:hypothetical protein